MSEEDIAADRRGRSDRRERSDGSERRGGKKATSPFVYVLRSIGLVVILVLVIVYTVVYTRPVFATRGTLGEELRKRAPEVAAILSPADSAHSANVDQLMATPKFQDEKRNFYEDV
ncbi:MAG: hypothetical protein ABI664_23185, partial [bacterium]